MIIHRAPRTAHRLRPIVTVTIDPVLHERLQQLQALHSSSLSRIIELVVTGQLELPPMSTL